MGPPPPWWDNNVVGPGQEVFVGPMMVDMSRRLPDPQASLALARAGAEMISKHSQEIRHVLPRAKG